VRRVDAATAPRVLWQGPGHYHSSFGACEETDIPAAEVVRPGTLLVQQIRRLAEVLDRGYSPTPALRRLLTSLADPDHRPPEPEWS
jgi:hypothetical protein